MNIRPTGNKVLVRPDAPPEKTHGGIIINPAWQTPSGGGEVLAVGPKVEHVTVGNRVSFSWINGIEIGNGLKVIQETELLGVLV